MPVDLLQVPPHDPLRIVIIANKRNPDVDHNDQKYLERNEPEDPVPLPVEEETQDSLRKNGQQPEHDVIGLEDPLSLGFR